MRKSKRAPSDSIEASPCKEPKKAAEESKVDWSSEPNRVHRIQPFLNTHVTEYREVPGLEDGPLRGGRFVFNADQSAIALSFCFVKDDDWLVWRHRRSHC